MLNDHSIDAALQKALIMLDKADLDNIIPYHSNAVTIVSLLYVSEGRKSVLVKEALHLLKKYEAEDGDQDVKGDIQELMVLIGRLLNGLFQLVQLLMSVCMRGDSNALIQIRASNLQRSKEKSLRR